MSVKFAPRYTAMIVAGLFAVSPIAAQAQTAAKAATPAKAEDKAPVRGVVVSDIKLDGLQRSDPASVFNAIPVKAGDTFTNEKAQEVIKALYATGLYENVDVGMSGTVMNIKVVERPTISDLSITGMKQFERKAVLETLKANGFAQGYAYDQALLERVKSELQGMYTNAGLVNVKIDADVKKEARNQVVVAIKVVEGDFEKVRKLTITGNHAISSREIRSVMETDKNGIFSWYTKDSRFMPDKFNADLESIKGLYYDNGFMEFDFNKVDVQPLADKKGIEVLLDVNEGVQYRVNKFEFSGNLKDVPRADIEKIVKYKTNGIYSRAKVSEVIAKVKRRFAQDGYALVDVQVQPVPNASTRMVDVNLAIEPKERVYVRHINIVGNSRTRDEVIRREVRQLETAIYDDTKVLSSRDRIDRLGFFSEVKVDTVPVEGTNNQVDVVYTVKEVPTGSLKLGLGYSSTDKLSLTGSVIQNNFMGTGNSLGVEIDTSKSSRNVTLSATNPYITKDGISQSAAVYYRTFDASKVNTSDVKYTTYGFSLIYGVPISENHRLFFGINPEVNKIRLDANSPASYQEILKKYGTNSFKTYALTAGWSYDTRDSGFAPTRGIYQNAKLEVSPVGTLKYYKLTYQYQQYVPLSKYVTFAFNTQFDYGRGMGGSDYPFFKNLYAGGLGSVRGYESGSVGPKDEKGNNLGGSKRFIFNTELQFPFPGMVKNRGVRLFAFVDGAGLWSDSYVNTTTGCDYTKISFSGCSGMRYSYGVGLSWNSPIGPLKLSYAFPIRKQSTDKLERFQFQIGTSF